MPTPKSNEAAPTPAPRVSQHEPATMTLAGARSVPFASQAGNQAMVAKAIAAGLGMGDMTRRFGKGMGQPASAASAFAPLTRENLIATQAQVTSTHKGELAAATAALARAGSDADVRGMYEVLRLLEGTSRHPFLRSPGRHFMEDRRSGLEGKLALLGLNSATFKTLAERFKGAFCAAALDLAFASLDAQRTLAQKYLDDASALKKLAWRMLRRIQDQRADLQATVHALSMSGDPFMSLQEQQSSEDARKQANHEVMRQFVAAELSFVNVPGFKEEVLLELMDTTRPVTIAQVEGLLRWFIRRYLGDLEKTHQSLVEKPERALQLQALVERAKKEFGIAPASIGELIIEYAQWDASQLSWDAKLKILAAFVLIATAMVFPGTTWASAALVADIGLNLEGLESAVATYLRERAAGRAGLRSMEVSLLNVVLSLIGLGLTAVAARLTSRASPQLSEALATFGKTRDVKLLRGQLIGARELGPTQVEKIVEAASELGSTRFNPARQLQAGSVPRQPPGKGRPSEAQLEAVIGDLFPRTRKFWGRPARMNAPVKIIRPRLTGKKKRSHFASFEKRIEKLSEIQLELSEQFTSLQVKFGRRIEAEILEFLDQRLDAVRRRVSRVELTAGTEIDAELASIRAKLREISNSGKQLTTVVKLRLRRDVALVELDKIEGSVKALAAKAETVQELVHVIAMEQRLYDVRRRIQAFSETPLPQIADELEEVTRVLQAEMHEIGVEIDDLFSESLNPSPPTPQN